MRGAPAPPDSTRDLVSLAPNFLHRKRTRIPRRPPRQRAMYGNRRSPLDTETNPFEVGRSQSPLTHFGYCVGGTTCADRYVGGMTLHMKLGDADVRTLAAIAEALESAKLKWTTLSTLSSKAPRAWLPNTGLIQQARDLSSFDASSTTVRRLLHRLTPMRSGSVSAERLVPNANSAARPAC
jgi:hypothetical protein